MAALIFVTSLSLSLSGQLEEEGRHCGPFRPFLDNVTSSLDTNCVQLPPPSRNRVTRDAALIERDDDDDEEEEEEDEEEEDNADYNVALFIDNKTNIYLI